jgi:hypothetical protein
MFFLWRRPGMTTEEFQRYYEERHTHHNAQYRPASADYRRNFPDPDDPWTDQEQLAHLGGFDVMTENWYPERASFEGVLAAVRQSPARERIAEDETRFEIREKKKVFAADEIGSPAYDSPEYELAATRNEDARFKLVRCVRRAEGLSGADFRTRYEASEGPHIQTIFANSIDCRRSYLMFSDPLSFVGSHDAPSPADESCFDCDVVEEIWYGSRDAATSDVARYREWLTKEKSLVSDAARSPLVVMREYRTARPNR